MITIDATMIVEGNLDVQFDVECAMPLAELHVTTDPILLFDFSSDGKFIDADCEFQWPEDRFPEYAGTYVIDPRKVQQELPTKETSLYEDIQVNGIYYSKVSNPEGGVTILIGRE